MNKHFLNAKIGAYNGFTAIFTSKSLTDMKKTLINKGFLRFTPKRAFLPLKARICTYNGLYMVHLLLEIG